MDPESLGGVVIEVAPQGHAGVPATTPPNGDRLLDWVIHNCPLGIPMLVYRQGLGQRLTPAWQVRHPPITPHVERREVGGLVDRRML